jgi:hypothetical protein
MQVAPAAKAKFWKDKEVQGPLAKSARALAVLPEWKQGTGKSNAAAHINPIPPQCAVH